MWDYLQYIRISTVNVFGIAIPGFLFLLFLIFGLGMPMALLMMSTEAWGKFSNFVESGIWILTGTTAILSYVVGSILRLTTPDKLDASSGKKVIAKEGKEAEFWPYTGEKNDKFPYFNFYKYLEKRGHSELLEHVTWGPDKNSSDNSEKETEKRSKTLIHMMKRDIILRAPYLTPILENNEAQIRLMSGIWLAIRATYVFAIIGFFICLLGPTVSGPVDYIAPFSIIFDFTAPHSYLIVSTFLLVGMLWAHNEIVSLFHYRRVNELFWIVSLASLARSLPSPTMGTEGKQPSV